MSFAPYRLPLRAPLLTARGTLTHREGVLLRDDEGRLGDACPLPGWSAETIQDVIAHLDGSVDRDPHPSESFAMATMAPFPTRAPNIDVCSLIDDARLVEQAIIATTTIKLKVGSHGHDADVRAIEWLKAQVPGLRLRLDGNRQLTVDHTHALAAAAGDALQWCEEPVPLSSLSSLDPALLLAADECFFLRSDDQQNVESMLHRAITWILKPMMIERLSLTRWQTRARQEGKTIVISSVFESAVGRAALMTLAADHPGVAHGLDTARFFAADLDSDTIQQLPWQPVI